MMPDPAPQPAPRTTSAVTGPIIARASNEYRVKRLIIVGMLIIMGAWFAYDGLVNWPRENQRIEQLRKDVETARKAGKESEVHKLDAELLTLKHHSDTDLLMQKVLGFSLPPLGLFVLIWSLYHSRGQYRLQENLLNVPGHPPIPLDAIRSIDRTDWDRKGIAFLNYELRSGKKGSARLDDFIYQRKPTDDIFNSIEDFTGTAEPTPAPSTNV
jgi:hypothetical protein